MRTLRAFIRLWAKGLISGQTRAKTIVRWIFYAIALWSVLVTLGLIRTFPFVVPFGLYYGLPDQSLHPFGFHGVLLEVLVLVFASYTAGVAWTRARWMVPKVMLLHNPQCVSCLYEFDDNRRRLAIGLQNIGAETIDGLSADLIEFDPPGPYFQSHLPLHIRNLRVPSMVSTSFAVTLHPSGDEHQHIEFIMATQSSFQILSASFPAIRHTGAIRIEGRQIRPQVFDFVLDIDAIGLPVLSLSPRRERRKHRAI